MANDNLFYGFEMETFEFDGTDGIVVKPEENQNGKIVLKTEYWNAFPELEIELLKRGFHLIHLKTRTRLATREDCDRKAKFIEHVSKKYNLDCKCVLVGMSCGGAQAVNFSSYYPQYVSCLVIDAPVLNFLDWPGRYNDEKCAGIWKNEFEVAYPGVKRCDIFTLKENPINNVPKLIEQRFPVIMLYGTEDMTVKYFSNGKLLEEAYSENMDLLTIIPRKAQGHHPHGLLAKSNELADIVMSKLQ